MPFARDRFSVEIASPREAVGVVLLARDNGNAVRRRSLSASLRGLGFATATCQLLTPLECRSPLTIKRMAADVPLLTARLAVMVAAVSREPDLRGLPVGILASGTVAAAALTFASRHPREVGAIVSREGRVDLAPDPETVRCPTLLIAGGVDPAAIRISQQVFQRLSCTKGIDVIAGATHGFHDSGAFELASRLACDWFLTHISAGVGS